MVDDVEEAHMFDNDANNEQSNGTIIVTTEVEESNTVHKVSSYNI